MHACMHACTHTHARTHTHTHTQHTPTHTHTTHMGTRKHTHTKFTNITRTHSHPHIQTFAHTITPEHVCTHAHTHTLTPSWRWTLRVGLWSTFADPELWCGACVKNALGGFMIIRAVPNCLGHPAGIWFGWGVTTTSYILSQPKSLLLHLKYRSLCDLCVQNMPYKLSTRSNAPSCMPFSPY